jgi:hypothetical protein
MPSKFKTPSSRGAPLVSGDGNAVLVIDAATRDELVRLRREALDAIALKIKAPNGALIGDSGNSPGAVQ